MLFSQALSQLVVTVSALAGNQSAMPLPAIPSASVEITATLAGTHWERCSFRYSHTELGKPDLFIFEKQSLTFTSPTTAQWITSTYATDPDCKETLGEFEAMDLAHSSIGLLMPTALDTMTLHIGEVLADGTVEVDLIWAYHPQVNSYHVARFADDKFIIAERCFNEGYIQERLCQRIDGNSPDNRATTFKMFSGEQAEVPFVKVP